MNAAILDQETWDRQNAGMMADQHSLPGKEIAAKHGFLLENMVK
jgi:hypothetical protein